MSSNNNRDDFTKNTIEKLKSRVAGRCSNPACRVPTTGPTSDPQKVNNIGVAAHICAAAPGGPRYDSSMTPEQRKDIQNAIWLCSRCSTDIDRDPIRYDVKSLHQWKNEAERLAREEMGKKLPGNNDVIDTVFAALTGLPKSYIPNAIENVCIASSKALEKLDPRFKVNASHQNNHTHISIYAKENVKGMFCVKNDFGQEFFEKYSDLIAHGKTLEIDASAISITGSKLLEEIFLEAKTGIFKIIPTWKKPATQKIWLIDDKNGELFILDDLVGEITLGRDSFSFNGNAFKGLLEFSFTHQHCDINLQDLKFSILVDFKLWNGQSVGSIQYFDKMYKFFQLLIVEAWPLYTKFEIEGTVLFTGKSPNFNDGAGLNNLYVSLSYIFLVREISNYLGIDLIFCAEFEYLPQTHEVLLEIFKVITHQNVYSADQINGNPSCVLVADEQLENINLLVNTTNAISLRIEQQQAQEIEIFGQNVVLPRFIHTFTKVKPSLSCDIATVKPSQEINVEWIPDEDCKYSVSLMS